MKRVFLIVLDSFGIGEAPDAAEYGDQGSNTLAACFRSGFLEVPNLKKLGLFNIDGVICGTKESAPTGAFGRCREVSMGKDTHNRPLGDCRPCVTKSDAYLSPRLSGGNHSGIREAYWA